MEESRDKKKISGIVTAAVVILILIAVISSAFTVVPTGSTGVRTTFGQISDRPVASGFNFKLPFVQDIVLVNNKLRDVTIETEVWGESSEKTQVYASDVVVSYRVSSEKSAWLVANVTDYENILTTSLVSSAIKNAMAELSADEVTIRSKIEPLVLEKLTESVNLKYCEGLIEISKVAINQMDFEDSYSAAITEKSIARQTQEKQAIENDTAIKKAEADKQVAITNAQAAAEEKKIAAQAEADAVLIRAEAEAEANQKISKSLTDEVLRSQYIDKWDGVMPKYVGGNSDVIVDLTGEE